MTVRYIKHRLIYLLSVMNTLLASNDTQSHSVPKLKTTMGSQKSNSSREETSSRIPVDRDLIMQLLVQSPRVKRILEVTAKNRAARQRTFNNIPVVSKTTMEIIEDLSKNLKSIKINTLDDGMPLIEVIVRLLKKANEDQDAGKVKEVTEILADFKNGCQTVYLLAEKHNLRFVVTSLFSLLSNISPYNYPNGIFLSMLLCYHPGPHLTADSIRTRFKTGFLASLTTNQIVRVLTALLSKNLCFSPEERKELVEMVFGQIDFSLGENYNNDQIIRIITAILNSDVSECFEEVFLTHKMWYIFTSEEQERVLKNCYFDLSKDDQKKYKRETLVMLYLFLLNKDETNSKMCREFMKEVVKNYGKGEIYKNNKTLKTLIDNYDSHTEEILLLIKTFDSCLLNLPSVMRKVDASSFKAYTRKEFYSPSKTHKYYGARYKVHVCYALSKFTMENTGSASSNGAIWGTVYFDANKIRRTFKKWNLLKDEESSTNTDEDNSIFVLDEKDRIELKNALCALRQIVQTNGYNSTMFMELYKHVEKGSRHEQMFCSFLFLLTDEIILKEVKSSPLWDKYKKDIKVPNRYCFRDTEDIFMGNLNDTSDINTKRGSNISMSLYLIRASKFMSNLLKTKDVLHRERFLCSRLFFHSKFKIFKDNLNKYIWELKEIRMLDEEKVCTQLARDLIFNDYYYEAIENGGYEFIENLKDLEVFQTNSITKEVDINSKIAEYRENERMLMNDPTLQ